MDKVIWAPWAVTDIESIAHHIARDSKDRASMFVSRMIEITDRLQEYPKSGPMIPEKITHLLEKLFTAPIELCIYLKK